MWGSIYIVTTFLPLLKRHFSGIPSDAYFIFCIPVLAAASEENKHFSSYVFMKIKHASPHECQTSCCGCWPSECWTHPTLWLGRCRGPVESTHPSAQPPPGWELQMMPVLTGSITHLPVVSYRIFSSRPYLHMELEFHFILPYHQRLYVIPRWPIPIKSLGVCTLQASAADKTAVATVWGAATLTLS